MSGFPTSQVINFSTRAGLSALAVLGGGPGALNQGYKDGQAALVTENGFLYVLKTTGDPANGTTILSTRDDSSRRWVEVTAAPSSGISNLIGGTDILVSNPSTGPTVEITSQAIVRASNPASLASVDVAGMTSGCLAYVTSTGRLYKLETAVTTTPENQIVIATADDAARQWVDIRVLNGSATPIGWTSDDVNAVAGDTGKVVIPALPGYYLAGTQARVINKSTAGAFTSNGSFKLGNNVTHDNVIATIAQLTTGVFSAGAGGFNSPSIVAAVSIDLATQIVADIVTPPAGAGMAWVVKFIVFGFLIQKPIP